MRTSLVVVLLLIVLFPRPAAADGPEGEEEESRAHEPAPASSWVADDPGDEGPERPAGLAISVEGSVSRRPERTDAAGMVLLTLPLDRLARRRIPRRDPKTAALVPRIRPLAAKQPQVEEVQTEPEPPKPVPVVVDPKIARAAVRAALVRARLVDVDARVEEIASRARTSALLPELRLRATRLVDESESLSPTEADPTRTTASGGASFWLEARATWRLDRLVFADEEIALEKIRDDRARARAAIVERVLELLFVWQHARAVEADDTRSADERLAATLRAIEAQVALDVATDGWFSRNEPQPRNAE